jgi:hypothetical protein
MLMRRALNVVPTLARGMSTEARPMTRFVQYPFDKTKMAEVTEWFEGTGIGPTMRSKPGIKDIEVSFCPGEGWLAARYIFNDLDDMVAFLGSMDTDPDLIKAKEMLAAAPHYDSSRSPHEFKGFFKPAL